MLHETTILSKPSSSAQLTNLHMVGICPGCSIKTNVLGDPFQHTLGFKDEGRQGNAAKVGSRPQLRDYRQQHCAATNQRLNLPKQGGRPTILLSIIDNGFFLLCDGIRIRFLTRITFKWKASATEIQTQSLRFPEPFLPFQCQPPFETPLNHLLPVFELPATGVE